MDEKSLKNKILYSFSMRFIVDPIESRGAFAVHIERCNDRILFGDKICKILVAKSLVFLGKVAENLLFYLKKKVFRASILNLFNYNCIEKRGAEPFFLRKKRGKVLAFSKQKRFYLAINTLQIGSLSRLSQKERGLRRHPT